jgi:hypothetical protein
MDGVLQNSMKHKILYHTPEPLNKAPFNYPYHHKPGEQSQRISPLALSLFLQLELQ